ncbi:hypothetical protein LCGC14_2757280, partial [marine sediment metagenome]
MGGVAWEMGIMHRIGLDAGSVSVKAVVLDAKGRKIIGRYLPHRGRPLVTALTLLKDLASDLSSEKPAASISITGSAGRLIAESMGVEPVNEIVAQALAVNVLYPDIRTVIEMGGEDSKLI